MILMIDIYFDIVYYVNCDIYSRQFDFYVY